MNRRVRAKSHRANCCGCRRVRCASVESPPDSVNPIGALLDLYGPDHDARTWDEPKAFRPERFERWDGGAFDFIPQGGGDHYANHRCAGEWTTIALMERAAGFLARRVRYDTPKQDLRVDFQRLPALPKSGMVIRDVQPAA